MLINSETTLLRLPWVGLRRGRRAFGRAPWFGDSAAGPLRGIPTSLVQHPMSLNWDRRHNLLWDPDLIALQGVRQQGHSSRPDYVPP